MTDSQVKAGTYSPKHLEYVDALRGWAIILVMCVHSSVMVSGLPQIVESLAEKGRYGVQLFFIMSAFTLFLSYESRRTRDIHPVLAFFVRRLFRIAPLFWLGMIFYIFYYGQFRHLYECGGLGNRELISTALFLHGWHPLTINRIVPGGWSIAAEMVFYLGVPLTYTFAKTMPRAIALFLSTLVIAAACEHFHVLELIYPWYAKTHPGFLVDMDYYWLPTQLPVFALGFLLYHLVKSASAGASGLQSQSSALLCLAICAGLCGTWLMSEQVLYASLFCIGAYALSQIRIPLLVNRITRHIGKVSFSAYITHFFVLDIVWRLVGSIPKNHAMNTPFGMDVEIHPLLPQGLNPFSEYILIYVTVIVITTLVSTLTYQIVELPGQNVGKWVIKKLGW